MTPYERPTEELRQVRYGDLGHHVYLVQRKHLVQDGPMHEPDGPERHTFMDAKTGRVHLSIWLKSVWKDLPIVTPEEARQ